MNDGVRVSTAQAAKELHMSPLTLRYFMQHGQLPIGMAQKREGNKHYCYVIYRGLLDKYKAELGITD